MSDDHHEIEAPLEDADALSPSVRRLVRQYDLDVTGIHGSGPHGRIRVGDVMAMIGGRSPTADAEAPPGARHFELAQNGMELRDERGAQATHEAVDTPWPTVPMAILFECDVSRVLLHRKLERERGNDVVLTAYFAAACARAMTLLGEPGSDETADLGVLLAREDGTAVGALVAGAGEQPFAAVHAQLSSALARGANETEIGDVAMVLHHHGTGGSLLALPLPLPRGRRAAMGVGAVRRAVAVRSVNGEESARIVSQCYLTLTFHPEAVAPARADRFLGECVRTLESWPP